MTQEKFNDWLNLIIQHERPGEDIIAYYFGIFEGTEGYEVYLVGSKGFDEDDDDWACNNDFEPANKYFSLKQPGADWEQILEDVKKNIETFTRQDSFKNSFLDKAEAIATGFDEGDLYRIK